MFLHLSFCSQGEGGGGGVCPPSVTGCAWTGGRLDRRGGGGVGGALLLFSYFSVRTKLWRILCTFQFEIRVSHPSLSFRPVPAL